MAIQKLEDRTVRVIGATQVLTDPASLVKELIDNALDAHATSIAVEIHSNTLDVIQVRDNGHGIAPEDRSLVAIPNCTSKLADFNDIKGLGGSSLGFRGQALASAAEVSGSLSISTRVEGEQVAAALKINQRGAVASQERASLPIGTTVRITEFFKAQPVRKQHTIKNAEKCLRIIKRTLQAYAFARPHVRLSLRVLKAKNDKGNWMYAPKPGGNAEDAALKIVGSACVSQCTWSILEDQGFTLHTLLPRPDGDGSKISGIGTFVSVDGRPVSAARGTLKQVVRIFRESLKAANAAFGGLKDPFLHLQISCPSASYDPNVEPAKDDVLFEDPDTVVELARRLFAAIYPVTKAVTTDTESRDREPNGSASRRPSAVLEDDFATSIEPQHTTEAPLPASPWRAAIDVGQMCTPAPTSDLVEPEIDADPREVPHRAFRQNMYGCDEEDLELMDARPPTGRTEADFAELRQARKDVTVSNPWVMAKMNTSLRPSILAQADDAVEPPRNEFRHEGIGHREDLIRGAETLPTPRPSSPSPPAHGFHASNDMLDERVVGDARLTASPALPPPQAYASPIRRTHVDVDIDDHFEPAAWQPPRYDCTLSSQGAEPHAATPLHAIPETSQRPRQSPKKRQAQGQLHRPFVSPLVDQPPQEKVWFDHLEKQDRARKRIYQPRGSDSLVQQGELGGLIEDPRPSTPPRQNRDIRDFVGSVDLTGNDSAASVVERRNYGQGRRSRSLSPPMPDIADENRSSTKAVLSARGFVPASELAALEARFGPINKEAPHPSKRRKTSEGRVLREVSGNVGVPLAGVADEDEADRAIIGSRSVSRGRRTTEGSTGKVHRTKSSRLPLERIPKGQGMHNVEVELSSSTREISRWAGKVDEERTLLGWNQPALEAYDAFASVSGYSGMDSVATRLHELLINHVSDGEMVQDLDVLVQDVFTKRWTEAESAKS